ncbi:unnamed protein product [Heterobilharzia americana]|nr:unnamed protein product [Heterobilharzia americana]
MKTNLPVCKFNGAEITKEIVWENWLPRRSYTKILKLHNVDKTLKTGTFSIPCSEVFSSTHPEHLKVAPGETVLVPITFRPTKKMEFYHEMSLQLSGKTINVALKGILPHFHVELPIRVDFGSVAVFTSKTQTFTLRNMMKLKTSFRLRTILPVHVCPDEGLLNSLEKKVIRISFTPKIAGSVQVDVECTFGDESCQQVKYMGVTGEAEHARIYVYSEDKKKLEDMGSNLAISLSFNKTSPGCSSLKHVLVENYSDVDGSIKIEPVSRNASFIGNTVFRSTLSDIIIPAQSSSRIGFTYTPRTPNAYDIGYFKICQLNGYSETLIKCVGDSTDINVQLSTNYCTFPITQIDELKNQVVYISNHTDHPTLYEMKTGHTHIYINENNEKCQLISTVFPLLKGSQNGIINPRETIRLVIGFNPHVTGHFYRRFVLLVCNQEPQFLHLLGTCHDLTERPHHLTVKHLANLNLYADKSNNGIDSLEKSNEWEKNKLNGYENYAEMMQPPEILLNPPSLSLNHTNWDFTSNSSLLAEATSCAEKLDKAISQGLEINFDNLAIRNILIVQNHTNDVMIINWSPIRHLNLPLKTSQANLNKHIIERVCCFRIEPISKELAPNSSTEFTILFTPSNICQYYHQEFEGFAMYKKQQDGALIDSKLIKPSHCLLVNCYGHTFPNSKQSFTPSYEISKPKVTFDSIEYCESKFESVSIYNKSEYPLFLQHSECLGFLNDETLNKSILNISLIPSMCLIAPNSYKVIVFHCELYLPLTEVKEKLAIREDEIKLKGLQVVSMNKRPEYEWKIPVEVNLTTPMITLDSNGELYFIPTHVGSQTQKLFNITNTSPYEIEFCWEINSDDQTELEVNPNKGILLPYEIQSQIWLFHPKQIANRIFKPRLIYCRSNNSKQSIQHISKRYSHEVKQHSLRVITMSDKVQLFTDPETITCQPMLVNTSTRHKVNFHNLSLVSTNFCSVIKPLTNVEENELKLDEFITIESSDNWISGHSTKSITIHICPKSRGNFCFQLFYRLYTAEKSSSQKKSYDTQRKYLTDDILAVTIFVEAVYPTLRITDIHGSGSLNSISPVELWRDLDIDSLNASLETDPTENELRDTINTRPLYRDHPNSVNTRGPEFSMLIGTSTVIKNGEVNNSKALLCLLIENSGLVDVEFAFLFPEDLLIELPSWAESGHYEAIELQHMHIENHSLFDIHPKRTLLKPGEYCEVMITYNHNLAGCHQLPVLLKINGGREIKLNMIGITLPLNQPYLQLTDRKYVFTPTPVGLGDFRLGYLFQMKLRNPSSRCLHFRVSHLEWIPESKMSIEVMKRETDEKYLEYGLPILYCVQDQGLIKSNGLFTLNWRFRPIEAKTYTAYCFIQIMDAEETPENTDQPVYSDTILLELIAIGYDPKQFGPKEVLANPQRVRIPTAIENHIIPTDRNFKLLDKPNDDNLTLRDIPPLSRRIKCPIDSWVSLSHHLLELHRIVLGTRCRRLIHMTNRSGSDNDVNHLPVSNRSTYRFRWFAELAEEMENVTVTPKLGRIKPGKTIQVLITYTASGLPRFTEINLVCEITKKKANTVNLSSESSEMDMEKFCQKWPKPTRNKPVYIYLTISAEVINEDAAKAFGMNNEENTSFTDYTLFLNSAHSAAKAINLTRVQDGIWKLHQQLFIDLMTSLIADLIYNEEFVQTIQRVVIPPENVITNSEIRNDEDTDDPVPLWTQIKDGSWKINEPGQNDSTSNIPSVNQETLHLQDWIPEIVKEMNNKQDMRSVYEETADNMCIQNPVFQSLVEDVLAGMLRNITDEVNEHEYEITTKPRVIALPPRNRIEDK